MVILVNFKGVGGSFSTPSPNEKGGPGAKSQAGTNREQSKHEQTVNKRRPLHGAFTLCPIVYHSGRG